MTDTTLGPRARCRELLHDIKQSHGVEPSVSKEEFSDGSALVIRIGSRSYESPSWVTVEAFLQGLSAALPAVSEDS